MTDISTVEYWKERLDNELKAGEKSECREIQREKSVVRFQLWKLIKKYNDLEKDEVRTKWHWWWQYNLAKRRIFIKMKKLLTNGDIAIKINVVECLYTLYHNGEKKK